jgi:hypothetical protein
VCSLYLSFCWSFNRRKIDHTAEEEIRKMLLFCLAYQLNQSKKYLKKRRKKLSAVQKKKDNNGKEATMNRAVLCTTGSILFKI